MATIEHDGLIIESNHETEEAMRAAVETPPEPTSDISPDHGDAPSEPSQPESTPDPQQHGKKAKPRDNFQARLSQLTEQRRQEKERADRLEAELTELRSRPAPRASEPPPATEPPKPKAPSLTKVEYPEYLRSFDAFAGVFPDAQYEDFTDARTDFRRESLSRPPDFSQAIQQELTRSQQEWAHQQRCRETATKHPDYHDAIATTDAALAAQGLQFSPAFYEAVKQSTRSGDLIYYLATHPEESIQLARETVGLENGAAAFIRSHLESRLGAGAPSGAVARPAISTAKAPIKPVGSSPINVPDEGSDEETFDTYFRRENAKDRKAGRW